MKDQIQTFLMNNLKNMQQIVLSKRLQFLVHALRADFIYRLFYPQKYDLQPRLCCQYMYLDFHHAYSISVSKYP